MISGSWITAPRRRDLIGLDSNVVTSDAHVGPGHGGPLFMSKVLRWRNPSGGIDKAIKASGGDLGVSVATDVAARGTDTFKYHKTTAGNLQSLLDPKYGMYKDTEGRGKGKVWDAAVDEDFPVKMKYKIDDVDYDKMKKLMAKQAAGTFDEKKEKALGHIPNFLTGVYDGDQLTAGARREILDKIFSSGKRVDAIYGPAGAGKSTYAASQYKGGLITESGDLSSFSDFAVIAGGGFRGGKSRRGRGLKPELTPAGKQLFDTTKSSGGRIKAIAPTREKLTQQRNRRAEEAKAGKLHDRRPQSQIEGTRWAPGTKYANIAELKKQYGNVDVIRMASQGLVPNFAKEFDDMTPKELEKLQTAFLRTIGQGDQVDAMIKQTQKELGAGSKKPKRRQRMFGIEIDDKTVETAGLEQLFKNINKHKYKQEPYNYAPGTNYKIVDMLTEMESARGRLSAGHIPNFANRNSGLNKFLKKEQDRTRINVRKFVDMNTGQRVHQSKKGKGSYKRKDKHNKDYFEGFVPNFASLDSKAKTVLKQHPEYSKMASAAMKREASFGVTPVLTTSPGLGSPGNLAVVNKEQERGSASIAKKLHGSNFKKDRKVSRGSVPNFITGMGDDIGDTGPGGGAKWEKRITKSLNAVSGQFQSSLFSPLSAGLSSLATKMGGGGFAGFFGDVSGKIEALNQKGKPFIENLAKQEKTYERLSGAADKASQSVRDAADELEEMKKSAKNTKTKLDPKTREKTFVDSKLEAQRQEVKRRQQKAENIRQERKGQKSRVGVAKDDLQKATGNQVKSLEAQAASSEKFRNKMFQASFTLPMLTGQLQQLAGESSKLGKFMGGMGEAVSTASAVITVLPGQFGLIAGGILAATGGLSKLGNAASDIAGDFKKAADQSKANFQKTNDALGKYLQSLDKFNSAIGDASSPAAKINKLQHDLANAMAEIPAAYRRQILATNSATEAQEEVAKIQDKINKQNQQRQQAANLATAIDEQIDIGELYGLTGMGPFKFFGGTGRDDIFSGGGGANLASTAQDIFKNLNVEKITQDIAAGNNVLSGSAKQVTDRLMAQYGANLQLSQVIKKLSKSDFKLLQDELGYLAENLIQVKRETEALANLEKNLAVGRAKRSTALKAAKENEEQAREIFKGATDFLREFNQTRGKNQRETAMESIKGAIGFGKSTGTIGKDSLQRLEEMMGKQTRRENVISEVQKLTTTNKKAMFAAVAKFSGLARALNKISKEQGSDLAKFERNFLEVIGKSFDTGNLEDVERELQSLINNNKKALGGTNFALNRVAAIAEKQLQELSAIRQKSEHQEKLAEIRNNIARRQIQFEKNQGVAGGAGGFLDPKGNSQKFFDFLQQLNQFEFANRIGPQSAPGGLTQNMLGMQSGRAAMNLAVSNLEFLGGAENDISTLALRDQAVKANAQRIRVMLEATAMSYEAAARRLQAINPQQANLLRQQAGVARARVGDANQISADQIASKLKLHKMPDDINAMLSEMTRLTNLQEGANQEFRNFSNSVKDGIDSSGKLAQYFSDLKGAIDTQTILQRQNLISDKKDALEKKKESLRQGVLSAEQNVGRARARMLDTGKADQLATEFFGIFSGPDEKRLKSVLRGDGSGAGGIFKGFDLDVTNKSDLGTFMSSMLADLSQAAGKLGLTGIDQMIAATDIEKAGIVRSMAASGGQKQIFGGLSGKALDDKINEFVQVVLNNGQVLETIGQSSDNVVKQYARNINSLAKSSSELASASDSMNKLNVESNKPEGKNQRLDKEPINLQRRSIRGGRSKYGFAFRHLRAEKQ